MATRIDLLVEDYERVVKEPWSSALSGQERIWFLVYDPAEQRKVDLRLGDFETAAILRDEIMVLRERMNIEK